MNLCKVMETFRVAYFFLGSNFRVASKMVNSIIELMKFNIYKTTYLGIYDMNV